MLAAAANHHAAAVTAAEPNRSLYHGGQYDHTLGLVEQILGNVVGNVENLFQHLAGLLHAFLFLLVLSRERGRCQQHQRQDTCRDPLHEIHVHKIPPENIGAQASRQASSQIISMKWRLSSEATKPATSYPLIRKKERMSRGRLNRWFLFPV